VQHHAGKDVFYIRQREQARIDIHAATPMTYIDQVLLSQGKGELE